MSHGAREDSKDARVKEGRGGREGGESSKEHGKGTWKVERQWRIAITINLHASGHSTCLYRPFILTMPGAYFRLYISWTPIRDSQLPSFNPHPTSFPSLLSPSHLSLAHTTLENSTKKVLHREFLRFDHELIILELTYIRYGPISTIDHHRDDNTWIIAYDTKN